LFSEPLSDLVAGTTENFNRFNLAAAVSALGQCNVSSEAINFQVKVASEICFAGALSVFDPDFTSVYPNTI
jgi:hypothetical protein